MFQKTKQKKPFSQQFVETNSVKNILMILFGMHTPDEGRVTETLCANKLDWKVQVMIVCGSSLSPFWNVKVPWMFVMETSMPIKNVYV